MERQKVLERAHLIAVMSARNLQLQVGSAAIMAEQCAKLVAAAERPNVSVHIVPDENTGMWAELDIASNGGLITVCMSTALQDVTSTEPETIDNALREFERVLGLAMPCCQSLDFMACWCATPRTTAPARYWTLPRRPGATSSPR